MKEEKIMIRNINEADEIPIYRDSVEYDWLLHIKSQYTGITKGDIEAQKEKRFSVKRFMECPNCYVIMPASDILIKNNPL